MTDALHETFKKGSTSRVSGRTQSDPEAVLVTTHELVTGTEVGEKLGNTLI